MDLVEMIVANLTAFSCIGEDPRGGFTRLGYSHVEDQMHGLASYLMERAGLSTEKDAACNLVGTKHQGHGRNVMFGTHLDSVICGGNYDGIVGFISALEAIRHAEMQRMEEDGTEDPFGCGIETRIFRAEESTAYGRACLGSSAGFGFLPVEEKKRLTRRSDIDHPGERLYDSIRRNDGDPDIEQTIEPEKYSCYIEVHIEQSNVLEKEDIPIGIVTSIRAPVRHRITLSGQDSLYAASDMILLLEDLAQTYSGSGIDMVATVGKAEGGFEGALNPNTIPGTIGVQLSAAPGMDLSSIEASRGIRCEYQDDKLIVYGRKDHSGATPMGNRIDALAGACQVIRNLPSYAVPNVDSISFFSDIRSNDFGGRDRLEQEYLHRCHDIASAMGLGFSADELERSAPQRLDPAMGQVMALSADEIGIPYILMPSGAGHDALKSAQAGIPTVMLFCPSIGGISHDWKELSRPEDIAYASQIVSHFLRHYAKDFCS